MKEAAAEKSAKEIYLPFLYFARDAHFRRTTEESEINEYSGATGAELDCTGWRDEREKKRKGSMVSARVREKEEERKKERERKKEIQGM